MTNINFNESSVGQVNSPNVALEIKNIGKGGCLKCITPGTSNRWVAVWGETDLAAAVVGVNHGAWLGVHGISTAAGGHGVFGEVQHAQGGAGVVGKSVNWIGVHGTSKNSVGVFGASDTWAGVWGETSLAAAVVGLNKGSWVGVHGISTGAGGHGVYGEVQHAQGGAGVIGKSKNWVGVYGESETKVGIWGKAPVAGYFDGIVQVTGDIELINGDCAEDFDIAEENVEPGTVMVLNESGSLQPSFQEYDKKVAGIVSGAGGYKPAIILDSQHSQDQSQKQILIKNQQRLPIALMGKVYCKIDAKDSLVEIGDLLTTSSTKGYAMKAEDPGKAFGAVIGKALGSIEEEMGMIPILVALQ